MSLGREDMLRELELWPMWQLRHSQVAPLTTAIPPVPAITPVLQDIVADAQVAHGTAVPEPAPRQTPLIETPWLLVSPQVAEADSQALLQAIVHAMQLPGQGWTLVQHAVTAAETQSRFVVLFGLEAASAFLGAAQADLQALRGRLHMRGDMQWIVTHHPREMLAQPALKREVWHDLCLLLSKKD